MASLTTSVVSLADGYRAFTSNTTSKVDKFKPLNAWINSSTRGSDSDTAITTITLSEEHIRGEPRTISRSELREELERDSDYELYIVENITPGVLILLGGYRKVDPQFFLDHLGTVLPPRSNTKEIDPLPCGSIFPHT